MSNNKPEALLLADSLAHFDDGYYATPRLAAAELRRQHELIVEMREALEKAMPILALLVLAGSSEADELGVTIGKLVTKLEGKQ